MTSSLIVTQFVCWLRNFNYLLNTDNFSLNINYFVDFNPSMLFSCHFEVQKFSTKVAVPSLSRLSFPLISSACRYFSLSLSLSLAFPFLPLPFSLPLAVLFLQLVVPSLSRLPFPLSSLPLPVLSLSLTVPSLSLFPPDFLPFFIACLPFPPLPYLVFRLPPLLPAPYLAAFCPTLQLSATTSPSFLRFPVLIKRNCCLLSLVPFSSTFCSF